MPFPFVSRRLLLESEARHTALQQEFQNYRRRNEHLEAASRQKGQDAAIKSLLPVYDNLLRALEQSTQDEAFRTGIEMTMTTLKKQLSSLGVTEIPALGLPFDPAVHEAMDHITDPQQGENIVTKVVLTGFARQDTVLRHALVVVAN